MTQFFFQLFNILIFRICHERDLPGPMLNGIGFIDTMPWVVSFLRNTLLARCSQSDLFKQSYLIYDVRCLFEGLWIAGLLIEHFSVFIERLARLRLIEHWLPILRRFIGEIHPCHDQFVHLSIKMNRNLQSSASADNQR